MTETIVRLYETMFLVDNARAKENIEAVLDELKELVARAGGEAVNCGKWDERKLAYEISGRRRGTYCLCHWKGPTDSVAKLERACQLSQLVTRTLTLRDEDGVDIPTARDDGYARRDGVRAGAGQRDQDRGRDREGSGHHRGPRR